MNNYYRLIIEETLRLAASAGALGGPLHIKSVPYNIPLLL